MHQNKFLSSENIIVIPTSQVIVIFSMYSPQLGLNMFHNLSHQNACKIFGFKKVTNLNHLG